MSPRTAAAAPRPAPPAPRLEPGKPTRHIGDFMVHAISGSFRKQPAVLTERVVARDGDAWVIEYKLEDDDGARMLRVWNDANGDIARVSILVNGEEQPGTLADYEAFMASTSVVPDENDGFTASTRGTCTVGPSELDCETKMYRVMLGDQEASLGITDSHSVPGIDLAGEITAADGTVIYRSVLIEHGNAVDTEDDSFALGDD